MRWSSFAALVLFASLVPALALADGTSLRANLVEPNSIKLDGVPKEWSQMTHFDYTLKGSAGKPDIDARGAVAYDQTTIYIAADVTDDVLRPGGDHVELVIGFPGGTTHEVELFPGDPGKSPGSARTRSGGVIAGARVVEAPHEGGWSLEASIPWSTFPEARLVRVGMRGALFVHDADAGTTIKNVVGTAPGTSYASLPPLSTESEQALGDGLLHEKGLSGAPRCNLVADVVGDAMKERVLVFDHYLVVLGPNYRKGSEYFFTDLDADVLSCETKDVTGDGQAEILVKKRIGSGSVKRDVLMVMSFGSGDVPQTIFQHEYAITNDHGSIANDLSFMPDGGKMAIRVTPGSAKGLTAGNYREPTETSWDPVLLPWGTIASQVYKLSSGKFDKASEEKQAGTAAPPAAQASASVSTESSFPRAPPPPSSAELLEKVYELYKKDRGVTGQPRYDLAADVSGDGRAERILVHDRDVVVFGKGFKGGTGYAFLTLSQFASARDILEVSARDVTGDGKAEILVRGVQHGPAPPEAGGGTIDREIVLVFTVAGDQLRRVFAAETARSLGSKRVAGSIAFRGGEIVLAPGRATAWDKQTYPFQQDAGPVGGVEPLLLPWSGAQPQRYRWTGSAFAR